MNFGMKNQEIDVTMVGDGNNGKTGKKRSVMQKQKIAAFALVFCILFLGVAIAVANHFVAIYYIRDEYIDASGEKQTDRYTVKREGGSYKMFSREGDLMEIAEEYSYQSSSTKVWYNVFIAENSGNQYMINSSTGEFELYAVVDYDESVGETLGGTAASKRVMMFPRISQDETYSIRVSNQYGSYELYRQNVLNSDSSTGKKYTTEVMIRGTEGSQATYDATLFASLCVSCGYTVSIQKLDFKDPETPRDENGNVRFADYGLENVYDENGNLTYAPAVYTIVKGEYDADGYCSPALQTVETDGKTETRQVEYTVKVGYPILSGGGYYVQLEGRDTVYILSSQIENTVLKSVEALVTPMAVYPMEVSTYMMVYEFSLKSQSGKDATTIASFNYVDVADRDGSILTLEPYENLVPFMSGYKLNSDRVSKAMELLYQMQFVGCKKLSPSTEDFLEYGFDQDFFRISFKYDPNIASTGKPDEENYVQNDMIISQCTEDGTRYVYSELYDMIVEVEEHYFTFLNWENRDWYNSSFFQNDISYMKEMSFKLNGVSYDFLLDNSLSYAYYDKGDGTGERINLSTGTLSGDTYTVTKTGKSYKVYRMDLENGETYYDSQSGKTYYIGQGDKGEVLVEISVNNNNLQIYQKTEKGNQLIDYVINQMEDLGYTGTLENKTYTAADNFRRLYTKLLQYSLEGDADLTLFEPDLTSYITEKTPISEIRYALEDLASVLNPGNFEENNKREVVIRFYEYPGNERRLLLTIEMVGEGQTPNPANGQGRFYVQSAMLSEFFADLESFVAGQLVTSPI